MRSSLHTGSGFSWGSVEEAAVAGGSAAVIVLRVSGGRWRRGKALVSELESVAVATPDQLI